MDEEKLEYSFTGDVSSLRAATMEAISLLDKYEGTIKGLAASSQFTASKTAFTGFQRTVNGLIKQTNSLSKFMNKSSEDMQKALTPDTSSINTAVNNIADALQYLQGSTSVTTDDMKMVTMVLKDAQGAMETVASKATALGGSFAAVAQLEERTAQATQSVSGILSSSSLKMLQNQPFIQYAKQAEEGFNLANKSAEESAQVFIKAGKNGTLGLYNGIYNVSTAIVRFRGNMSSMANTLRESFASMGRMFDPITTKLQSFKDKAASHLPDISTLTEAVSRAFRRVAQSADSADDEVDQIDVASKSLNNTLRTTQKRSNNLGSSFKALGSTLNGNTKKTNTFSNSMRGLHQVGNLVNRMFTKLVGVSFIEWVAKGIKGSIDFTENLNLFKVAMGDSVDKGHEFVDAMSEVYGMDPSNLYKTSGYFYQLTDAIGMADDASATLSLSLTKASNDIASLFNVDVQTVVEDLASGMQGMSRSVRKYGMDIRATTLEQTAMSLGINDNVETMSEANRMALRFITMMKQVSNATKQTTESIDGSTETVGDFARTIEEPANQLRIFKEQMAQLARAIGNFFVPALKKVLPLVNGFIMALRTALTFIATLTGFTEELADSTGNLEEGAGAIEDIGDSANSASKKLKKMLAPFDELNVMSKEQSDSEGVSSDIVDPRLQEAINNLSLDLENIEMEANRVRNSILAFLGFEVDTGKILSWDSSEFEKNLIQKFPEWSGIIEGAFENWTKVVDGFKAALVVLAVFPLISAAIKSLGGISGIINTLTTVFSGATAAGGTLAGTLGAVVGWIAIVVGAIALLYTNSTSFADSFNNLLSSLWQGLQPVLNNIKGLFETVWTSIQSLWNEHVQPMLEKTGDALAPVLDTVSSLWQKGSVIIADFVKILESAWTEIIHPVFAAICGIVEDVMEVFQILWENFLGPIINEVADSTQRLWSSYIKPIIDKVINIVSNLIDIIKVLWDRCLAPVVKFLANTLGPVFTAVFQAIWGTIEFVMNLIFDIIDVLLGVLDGVIEFIAGVFTGDWKKALSGLLNIFVALGNGIIGVLESALNFGISLINSFLTLVVGGIKGLINGIGGLIENIADMLGFKVDLGVNWNIPQISKLSIPRIPRAALASGGVVTSPTQALIGEGKYDEAVIPLGNSPQMRDLVDEIADAVNRKPANDDPIQVNVYIGNEQVADYVHRANRRRDLQTNGGT